MISRLDGSSHGENPGPLMLAEPPVTRLDGGRLDILEAALEAAANSVMICDREARILWVNTAFTKMTGYAEREVLGQNPRILKSGEHDTAFYQQLWSTVVSGQVWRGEITNRHKNGVAYVEEMTITPVRDEHGEIRHFIAIKQDVTWRKQAEEALLLTQIAVDRAADGLVWFDDSGRIRYANYSICQSLGYDRLELLSMRVQQIHPDISPSVWQKAWDNGKGGAHTFETRNRRKDGTTFPARITLSRRPLRGREYGFAAIRDITADKQAEATLAEQRHLFEFLMDNVPDHIYFKDRQSRFIRISRAHAKLFGLNDAALAVGKSDFEFFDTQHAARTFADEQKILQTGQPMMGVVEKETWVDGRETWVATSKMPFTDADGQCVGIFGISRNITRSKLAENALRASEEFAKRIIESSSDGVGVIDIHGALIYLSASGQKLLELDEDTARRHPAWLGFWEGPDLEKARAAIADAWSGGIGVYQGSFRGSQGNPRLWDVVVSPSTRATGEVERLVCVFSRYHSAPPSGKSTGASAKAGIHRAVSRGRRARNQHAHPIHRR